MCGVHRACSNVTQCHTKLVWALCGLCEHSWAIVCGYLSSGGYSALCVVCGADRFLYVGCGVVFRNADFPVPI